MNKKAEDVPETEAKSRPDDELSGYSCVLDGEGHCITCSDEALPVSVLRVDQVTGMAWVTLGEVEEEVDITLVEEVEPGDRLLVHGGVAMANLSKEISDERARGF